MQSLLQVRSFANEWHRGQWRARDLPEAINAHVLWSGGGQKILGYAWSHEDNRAIVLNTRIRGTPLERPVVLHEAAHIIQRDLLGFCSNAWAERQCERDATYGSALLAIPTASAVLFATRRATAHELADYYDVPPALVYMRGALAVLLNETDGDMARARDQLGAARRSLESWLAWMARGI